MFAAKNYPDELNPAHLDAYLERGWYRMGQSIFTTHFLCFGKDFFSAVWVRLPLEGFQFGKRQAKLLRKNCAQFRCVFRPAVLDREKEELYQMYHQHFPGMLAPSLRDSLLDGEPYSIYRTMECAVYDGEKLVAASFFDLGEQSLSSIQGIYHPDYSKHSLGFFTMLMEIRFGLENGYLYFYPGYIVPGYSRFDYKLRIGEVEYLSLQTDEWLPYRELPETEIPIHKMTERLNTLSSLLDQRRIPHRILHYPLFEANLFGFWRIPFFDYPVMLYLNASKDLTEHHIVVFDPRTNQYQLLSCSNFDDIQFFFHDAYHHDFHQDNFFTQLIVINEVLDSSPDPQGIMEKLPV